VRRTSSKSELSLTLLYNHYDGNFASQGVYKWAPNRFVDLFLRLEKVQKTQKGVLSQYSDTERISLGMEILMAYL
ncbi:MAG: hypothetical protein NZ480_03705, partial [Bdellovibrionaceae bacterium]|nr:hypothetical protein [Pseudobdellovibrionaceae bacterium]MDW8191264.1 hypothetical protein [Pseudobdellovibrionaceae bacterium]